MPKKSKEEKSPRTEEEKKKVAKKDKPKRAMSAYLFFAKKTRPSVRDQNPDFKFGDITKAVATAWKELPEEEKKEYQEMARVAKEQMVN